MRASIATATSIVSDCVRILNGENSIVLLPSSLATGRIPIVKFTTPSRFRTTDITDEDALKRPLLVYEWDTYIGKSLKTGQIVSYESKLYRVRQDISTVIEGWAPQLSTASLYEVIEVASAGTIDDPIPYTPPMEIFNGKYYTQNGVKYKCIRDSQTALSHNLADLVALYVEVV